MNKNKELAKNTAIITVGKICTQFISFFLMPLYTAILTTEEYGIVDLVITYSSLLMPIVLLQIDQALFRFLIDYRNNKDGITKVLSTVTIFGIIQTLFFLLVYMIIQPSIQNEFKVFLLLNVVISVWANLTLQMTRGFGDNIGYSFASFLSAIIQIIGNIVMLTIFSMGVYGMLWSAIISQASITLFLLVRNKVWDFFRFEAFNRSTLKEVLLYSLPLIPNALCWWALGAADRLIVSVFLGVGSTGVLAVAHKFSSMYITFYNIFNLSWTESAALHMHEEDSTSFFNDIIIKMLKLFCCVGIGIIACMPFVFPVMINEQYNEAYGVIPIFMLASVFNVIVGLYSVIYVAAKKTKEIAKTSLYSGIINIFVHIALVKYIGLYAAAISTMVAFAVMAIYRYFDTRKYIVVKINKRLILILVGLFMLAGYSYYFGNTIVQIIVLFIISVASIMLNYSLVWAIIQGGLKMIRRG